MDPFGSDVRVLHAILLAGKRTRLSS